MPFKSNVKETNSVEKGFQSLAVHGKKLLEQITFRNLGTFRNSDKNIMQPIRITTISPMGIRK